MSTTKEPGLRHQPALRIILRITGLVLVPLGLAAFVWGLVGIMGTDDFQEPAGLHILALMGGVPVLGVGAMCLQAGFLGAAARYGAGETMPVVRDSVSYLSDGKGVHGVGRTVDDAATPPAGAGPYCRSCGRRNDEDAMFCDGCGTSLA